MEVKNCIICGTTIPIYNITNACKRCFDRYKRKDEFGNWVVNKEVI